MSGFNVVEFVGTQVGLFNQALSDQSITWQKEQQFAIQAFQKNGYLAKVAMGNPSSAQNAIINVAAIGITLNPAAKLAYLVPRDGGVHRPAVAVRGLCSHRRAARAFDGAGQRSADGHPARHARYN